MTIEAFRVVGQWLHVVFKNPNHDYGLVRARFSLAVLARDGSIIAVMGNEGLPGSLLSTIYQLPPGGEYVFSDLLPKGSKPVAHLELSLIDDWLPWSDMHPVAPKLSALSFRVEYGNPVLRGRVLNPGPDTLNIYVAGVLSDGGKFVTISDTVACVRPSENRAFEILGASPISARTVLKRSIAYPTTVEGVGTTTAPPGC